VDYDFWTTKKGVLLMTNHTRNKMQEARYFLEKMEESYDDPTFTYNFNAFVSAARSITYYMQKQYAHQEGFSLWYNQKQEKMKKDKELKYLNQARVGALKTEPINKGATREIKFAVDVILSKEYELSTEQSNEPQFVNPPENYPKTVRRFFPDLDDLDVVEFCENQLTKLVELVEECENLFLPII